MSQQAAAGMKPQLDEPVSQASCFCADCADATITGTIKERKKERNPILVFIWSFWFVILKMLLEITTHQNENKKDFKGHIFL